MEKKVKGARRIGQTWHYNIRVSKRLSDAYDLCHAFSSYKGGFIRGTMRTKCPDEAERNVRAVLAKLDQMAAKLDSISSRIKSFGELSEVEQGRLGDDLDARIAKLPHDLKKLLKGEGGVWKAGQKLKQFKTEAAFLEAGAGSEYEIMEALGKEYDPEDRDDDEAQERFDIERAQQKAGKYEKALTAAGVIELSANAVMGFRSLMDKLCNAKGYVHSVKAKNKTRGQYEYAVRRFVEYHGDLPISELTRKHLSDFSMDFLKLPVSSRKDIRPLAFWEAVRAADREGLPRASIRTRDQNLILLKSVLAFAFKEGDRLGVDPWAGYEPTVAKQKVSAVLEKHRHVFSRHEVQAIIAFTSKTRDPNTIDYWGPLFGVYYGLRLEEISQVRTVDLPNEEGFLCVTITDAGELQTVKNSNSFRTIPIHQDLIGLGFGEFVERRSKASGDMLFMEADRWRGSLHEIKPDGQGRHGTMYGSRFADKEYGVLAKLNIIGHKAGFHSFRHAWTDLARNAGINPEHRRALAGRDSEAESEGVRTDNTENRYGHGFAIAELAKSLNQLKPLG